MKPGPKPGGTRKPRTVFNEDQIRALTENFEASPYPSEHDVEKISLQTGLDRRVIIIWFQNRRSKYKKRIPDHISKSPEKNNNSLLIEENNGVHDSQTTAQKILLNFTHQNNNNSIEEPNNKRSKIEETATTTTNNNSNTNSLTATMMSWINEQAQT